ncbi:MAG: AAA domain-containing protein [Deltaproteobacteria bacterium]|nr:AAA domain-containing protein [Deltaproteobacteria bacterium]
METPSHGILQELKAAIATVVVGQDELIETLILTLLARGHILLEGVPGVAKSLVVETFARACGGSFNRFQFTPDKMPGDILGGLVFSAREESFSYRKGPIFCNFFLADEINRASPKVQSALLQAMQEREVSSEDENLPLPDPFMVMATQNPIEQVGTYPLAEAQIDRFMVKYEVGYLDDNDEFELLQRKNTDFRERVAALEPLLAPETIVALQAMVHNRVTVSDTVLRYILNLCLKSRPRPEKEPGYQPEIHDFLRLGASPRAAESLLALAKARAFFAGRQEVDFNDAETLLPRVLGHRLLLNHRALAEEVSAGELVRRILESTPAY